MSKARQEKEHHLDGNKIRDLRKHEWVEELRQVSVDYESTMVVVRFNTTVVPQFVFESDAFDVKEVWLDTLPAWWAKLIASDEWARDRAMGRDAVSILIEVTK